MLCNLKVWLFEMYIRGSAIKDERTGRNGWSFILITYHNIFLTSGL